MQIMLNGEPFDLSIGNTVQELLNQLQLRDRPIAVECNGRIVFHSSYDRTELENGDVLEVVTLVGGG